MVKPTKSREVRADLKDYKRAKKPKMTSKTALLDMVEVLIENSRVKHGICRHNHQITVTATGKILVDGEFSGYIDKEYTIAAKYLIEHGYHLRMVGNKRVIHSPDGEPTGVTVGDIIRMGKR